MKQIKGSFIEYPDGRNNVRKLKNMYVIRKPWKSYNFYFSNKKDALKFSANLRSQYNNSLYELNFLTGEVYIVYRQLWSYMEIDLSLIFKDIDTRFEYLLNAKNMFSAEQNFTDIVNLLLTALSSIEKTAIKTRQPDKKHYVRTLINVINTIYNTVYNYGENSKYRIDVNHKVLM